jgi:hypothetical protein
MSEKKKGGKKERWQWLRGGISTRTNNADVVRCMMVTVRSEFVTDYRYGHGGATFGHGMIWFASMDTTGYGLWFRL